MSTKGKGFTLIELLVVIAIIGLLSTLAIVALGTARMKSRDARRLADLKQIQTALELFYSDSSTYPVQASPGITLGVAPNNVCLNITGFTTANCTGPYLGIVPKDPSAGGVYTYIGNTSSYSVSTTLEGSMGGFNQGNVKITQNGLTTN